MKKPVSEFYCLADSDSDRLLATPEDASSPAGGDWTPCSANPGHARCVTPPADEHLDATANVRVGHNKRDQMLIWTWPPSPFVVIHDRLAENLQSEGFSGYSLRPATVRFRDGFLSQEYKRLLVTGWGGLARPESGIRLEHACPGCLYKSYTSLSDASELIDKNQWSGEDLFVVWPMPGCVFITGRVAEFLSSSKIKSFSLHALEKAAEPFTGKSGFGVGSLGDDLPMDLALKYGKPLGIV
jgi:hypothetical protein